MLMRKISELHVQINGSKLKFDNLKSPVAFYNFYYAVLYRKLTLKSCTYVTGTITQCVVKQLLFIIISVNKNEKTAKTKHVSGFSTDV